MKEARPLPFQDILLHIEGGVLIPSVSAGVQSAGCVVKSAHEDRKAPRIAKIALKRGEIAYWILWCIKLQGFNWNQSRNENQS